ncbi:MAG TPA: pyruvate:ferredoxin (flavodoxin) oxidoreductase [Polyangiaceae bacterium]|nr:pyruvate:ferredoxin (flavodoxin) oxidoreductase [Polyangiaceae bacterium]
MSAVVTQLKGQERSARPAVEGKPGPEVSHSLKTSHSLETLDGNQAAADVAYRLNEVIAIYPITPASPMGEFADEWAARGRVNIWGDVPSVTEMQSEAGAAGVVHGALTSGALSTTFTASQGLLLMIPNFYKIAGELQPFVVHVAARTLATHALSIFGDHSDVMACRATGFAMLAAASPQEAHDMACVAHAAALTSRVPFMHFFDGFRTSHELTRVSLLSDDVLRAMIDERAILEHRRRALTPDRPSLRGTAQNPDTYFQAREAVNPYYAACPDIVERTLDHFANQTGRRYKLFEYVGHPEATDVIVAMGSGALLAQQVAAEKAARGERVGALLVRLFRPFSARHLAAALPSTVERISVLDRTKEPGAAGEPLYLDVMAALFESPQRNMPRMVSGRYGLSSKEFTPEMVEAVFANLASSRPRRHFSVGIVDDVTNESLTVPAPAPRGEDGVFESVFFGLGSDGTVGANKNTIKIVSSESSLNVQGYFVYDSKKSGAVTISHLRFSEATFQRPYLIREADFVGCHQFDFLETLDVVSRARHSGTLLVNSPFPADEFFQHVPLEVWEQVREKNLNVYVVDAYAIASKAGLGRRINTVMQACFFALTNLIKPELAVGAMKHAIEESYGKKGGELVRRNWAVLDNSVSGLSQVKVPEQAPHAQRRPPRIPGKAPDFVQRVTAAILEGHGDLLPVSAFPVDGCWPTATARWEKRNIAAEIPVWDPSICVQCNKCALVCPHAAIRAKVYDPAELAAAPPEFKSMTWKGGEFAGKGYTIQVAPEDCTGCHLCVEICPAKDKSNPRHKSLEMAPQRPLRESEARNFEFFIGLPAMSRSRVRLDVKSSQLLDPLFEFSGACPGCGETPYVKLLTQLFGDRLLIANATGCSSIYGGNLPTTPYTVDGKGRGPAWANSLFEDNAEFGFGMRVSVDQLTSSARSLLRKLQRELDPELVQELLTAAQDNDAQIDAQRARVERLRAALSGSEDPDAVRLLEAADYLVKKSVWLVGGDGWAYDIGFGGLDHVLASNRKINVLVLDTEVYSNTGGQQSKATPLGAVAKYATLGKSVGKKDLGLLAMSYGHVYVASIAFGAKDAQTVRALAEADAHPGPSLVIAYSHCIAHGYELQFGAQQQKLAVDSGVWPLYTYNPQRTEQGERPLVIDQQPGKAKVREYMNNEARFRMLEKTDKARFEALLVAAEHMAARRNRVYEELSHIAPAPKESKAPAPTESRPSNGDGGKS